MKKTFQTSLFFCLLLSATFTHAQIQVGVRAGVNLARYQFKFTASAPAPEQFLSKNAPLLTVGIPIDINLGNHFSVQTEINFSQKGANYHLVDTTFFGLGIPNTKITADAKLIVNWLEMPILIKRKFILAKGFNGGLFLGPSFGYGLSGKQKGTLTFAQNGTTTHSETNEKPLSFKNNQHSRTDVALNIGGEINYGPIYLDARYQLGFTNMFTNNAANTPSTERTKAYTRGAALTVGYRLPLNEAKKSKTLDEQNKQPRIQIGLRGGVNLATYKFRYSTNLSSTYALSPTNATLLTFGVPIEISLNKNFSLQTELNFIEKGFALHISQTQASIVFITDNNLVVNWLEIPVLTKIKFGTNKSLGGGFYLGPSLAYGLSGKSKTVSTINNGGLVTTQVEQRPVNFTNDPHARLDFCLNFGGEMNYKGVYLDARYQLGISDMLTDSHILAIGSPTSNRYTRGVALALGYRLPIGAAKNTVVKTEKK